MSEIQGDSRDGKQDATSGAGQQEPWAQPGWYKTRKFVGAAVTTLLCLAAAGAAGHLSVETGIACSAPLLAWAGLHLPQVIVPPKPGSAGR